MSRLDRNKSRKRTKVVNGYIIGLHKNRSVDPKARHKIKNVTNFAFCLCSYRSRVILISYTYCLSKLHKSVHFSTGFGHASSYNVLIKITNCTFKPLDHMGNNENEKAAFVTILLFWNLCSMCRLIFTFADWPWPWNQSRCAAVPRIVCRHIAVFTMLHSFW